MGSSEVFGFLTSYYEFGQVLGSDSCNPAINCAMQEAVMPDDFELEESYEAEKKTRAMIAPFLAAKGFTEIGVHSPGRAQTLAARDPSGRNIVMRVKLCWRQRNKRTTYAATQLLTSVKDGRWREALDDFCGKLSRDGVTHLLVVQREGDPIVRAALVEVEAITSIWQGQRDEGNRLIQKEALGRRVTNPAENGNSPTLWLRYDLAPSIPDCFWKHEGVIDLIMGAAVGPDTWDDLGGLDRELLGRDEAERVWRLASGVKRDAAVRREVLRRAKMKCERPGCGEERTYEGFLDVHHIMGVEKSDRLWTCVALCPNCHREAHVSPESGRLNEELLEHAAGLGKRP